MTLSDYPTTRTPSGPFDADVAVIGGGAAGLTAAQVLGRARRSVVLIDGHAQRNAPAERLHGYLGGDGVRPLDLVAEGRDEATRYGVRLVDGHVAGLRWHETTAGFDVELTDGSVHAVRAVLVATGLRDELPAVPGLAERWGVDVLHCPFCHGYEVRDRPLAVLGGANRELSVHQALLLPQWSDDVVFLTNGIELADHERRDIEARGVHVIEDDVRGIVVADDRLRAIELASGQLVPRAAVFVAPVFVPNDQPLRAVGCDLAPDGAVLVDVSGRTSVPGVWAAGNVIDPRAQVITAAGQGSAAAIAINGHLLAQDVASAAGAAEAPFTAGMEAAVSRVLQNARRAEPGATLS